jgi:hypothetical protein
MNPYYPVEPCPYANPNDAPPRLRFIVANGPDAVLFHAGYEFSWMFRTGIPRAVRMLTGQERFMVDRNILREGYHASKRTRQYGRNTYKSRFYLPQR